jgi:hypothetical protein
MAKTIDRRATTRPVSTLRRILDVTYKQIRKTAEKYGCFKVRPTNVQTDAR